MKHTYLISTSWLRWLCLCLLLAIPGLGMAQTVTITPNTADDPQDFGSVPVNTASASKTYAVTGNGLAVGSYVAIDIPAFFQGSTDNVNFSTSRIIFMRDGSGNVASTIYLRFRPTQTGTDNDFLTAFAYNNRNRQIAASQDINLIGNGTPGSPTITINPNALGFGNQIVNTTSSPMTVAVSGTSLTADITVVAPTDFLVSSDGATYGAMATLAQTSGSVNTILYVEFRPSKATGYNSVVNLTSGIGSDAATKTIQVGGVGVAPTPVLNVSPTALSDFGSVVVGNSGTATNSFTVDGQNLQNSVTITPPAGFRIRTGTNVFSTNPVVLTVTNGTIPSTTIDVRFTPTAAQPYKDSVSVSTPNGSTAKVAKYVKVSGTATPAPATPTVVVNPGALSFGTVTSSGSAGTLTFEVSGTNLLNNIVLTPSATSIQFRNASTGGAFSNGPITLMQSNGTVTTQTIEVKLGPTVPQGIYNEQINAASGTTESPISISATNNSGAISDISVVNPKNNSFTFVTRPTTISATQTFLISATNLLQNLTVAPTGDFAGYFQVSSDSITFSQNLTFAPDASGNVTQRKVYVRFVPGDNPLTVNADIVSASSPAPSSIVTVTGISQPTIRLNRAIGAFPRNQLKGTTSATNSVRLDGFLLGSPVSFRFPDDGSNLNPTHTPEYEFSLDNGVTYVTMASVSPDANGSFSQNLLVRFAPVRAGNAAFDMEFSNASTSPDRNANYYKLGSGFGAVSGFAIATEPTVQSTASVTRSANGTNATIAFDLTNPPTGKVYGQNRLVFATPTYSTLPTKLFPQDQQSFSAGKTDNTGAYIYANSDATLIESSSDTYTVFSGGSSTFTVTGLDPNKQYYFYAFEFNNDGVLNAENYLVPNNQPLSPLPVELVSFTAQRSGKQVNLNWVTASEKNSRSFDVERSANGQEFTAILSKAAQGTSSARTSYDAVDRQPLPGLSYYRLKQLDLDGTVAYSPVVSVQSDGVVEMSIYPNPTAGKLTISLPQALAASAPRVRISDLMGRTVKELSLPATGEIDLSALPAGTYLVNVGGQQVRSRVVKY